MNAAGILYLSAALALGGRAPDGSKGIAPLSQDTYEEAVACGQSGADCAVAPYRLCAADGEAYSSTLATPFERVAFSAFDGRKAARPRKPMEFESANGWGVGIYVLPGHDFAKAGSIDQVVIERDDETVHPLTRTIAPATVEGPSGAKRTEAKGFFSFPMSAFAPTADIRIVFSGSGGRTTCLLDRARLSSLR